MVRFGRGLLTIVAAAAILALSASPAHALAKTVSGSSNGLSWTATSRIVGQTSTSPIASGGDPIYTAAFPAFSGTVGLLMDYGAAGQFVCSGTLLNDRRSIVTAGHCVSEGAGTANPLSTTVFFRTANSNVDTVVYSDTSSAVATRSVSQYFVNENYTGEVIDQNDIAVLRLSELAPAFATGYSLWGGSDLTGRNFTVAGYGRRSAVGGAEGYTGPGAGEGTGRLRTGDNRYDFAWGDEDFEGFFTDEVGGENFFGTADIEFSYVSDFDNGLGANDASCVLATDGLGLAGGTKFCNLGRGAREASIAGGDSGGPGFIDGMLASVNSYGLTFGSELGDYKCPTDANCLQSSWGEFNGFVPVAIHRDFIQSAMVQLGVPEPATWMQLMLGFGVVGGAMRRRARPATIAA